jgi:hypothetical protein
VSRFARNTVDSLSTIRKLKEKGVECYFEKENIWTFDGKGELLITIMSSLAQEESRSISENCTWGQRKRFSDGKVSVAYGQFLGYDKGEDGLVVNEEQAVIVKRIYQMFLEGATPFRIAKRLTAEGIPTPGKKEVWNKVTVKSILTNEKYKGDALLQKRYPVDFRTKKQKINEGEIPQYYVENAHTAIIDPVVFERVQREFRKRQPGENRHSGAGMFASRIKCGSCGAWYGAKVWHSGSEKYRRTVYQCNSKFKNDKKCETPHLDENAIKRLFVQAFNILLRDKDEIIASLTALEAELFGTADLDAERAALQEETAVVAELIQKCIDENARVALDQREYQERYSGLVARYDTAKARFTEVSGLLSNKKARAEGITAFISELSKQDGLITEFDERLWVTLMDYATVYNAEDIRFTFKDGREIKTSI